LIAPSDSYLKREISGKNREERVFSRALKKLSLISKISEKKQERESFPVLKRILEKLDFLQGFREGECCYRAPIASFFDKV